MAEKEYIERGALIETLKNLTPPGFEHSVAGMVALDKITNTPAADVVEVKHGYWVDKPTGRYCHIASWCSVCNQKSGIGGIESNRHKPYCPNCGAKMDREGKSNG